MVELAAALKQLNNVTSTGALALLSPQPTKMIGKVEQAHPAPGSSVTLADVSGSGIVTMIQFTYSQGDFYKHGRLQVFVDDEVIPSIDVDIGTAFLTAYDAATKNASNQMSMIMSNAAGFPTGSAGMRYPIPYQTRLVVKMYSPVGMSTTGGIGPMFWQIAYRPGASSPYRLKSRGRTQFDVRAYGATEQITLLDLPNAAGWHVYLAQACKAGASDVPYGYLERQQYFQVDGEALNVSARGVPTTASVLSSGGEDLYLNGWYGNFSSTAIINPYVLVTAANNANGSWVSGVDLLGLIGGVRFSSSLFVGWALKDGPNGTGALRPFEASHQSLFYLDPSVPFAPTAPTAVSGSALVGATAVVSVFRPKSDGSQPITGYSVTVNGQTFQATIDPNTGNGIVNVTGLSAGNYPMTATATNSVGTSPAVTGILAIAASATAPGAPTIGTATGGSTRATVTFTAPSSNGNAAITGYTATAYRASDNVSVGSASASSSPITVNSLPAGTAVYLKVKATNSAGTGAESAASNTVTTAAAALIDERFNYSDGDLAGRTTPEGKTWVARRGTTGTVTNKVYRASVAGSDRVHSDVLPSVAANCTVTLALNITAQPGIGAIVRGTGTQNINALVESGQVSLYVLDSLKGSAGVSTTAGAHTIALDARGNLMRILFDGAEVMTYTLTSAEASTLTGTDVGIASYDPRDGGSTQVTSFLVAA